MADKKIANLFINGVEVARIQQTPTGKEYLIETPDEVYTSVSKEEFKKIIVKYKKVCYGSWNKQLRADYDNLLKHL